MSGSMPKGDNPGNTTDPYGNPTGADAPPGTTPPPNVPTTYYTANAPYTGPTYAYTPQSGYASLADQLSKAFSLTPTSLATARTSLLPMYASPWTALYGGPSDPSFAQIYGQDPSQGTAPPPGTPAFIGQGGGMSQPPSNPNPPPGPAAPPPPPPPSGTPTRNPGTVPPGPGTSNPGAPYPGPGGVGTGKIGGGPGGNGGAYTPGGLPMPGGSYNNPRFGGTPQQLDPSIWNQFQNANATDKLAMINGGNMGLLRRAFNKAGMGSANDFSSMVTSLRAQQGNGTPAGTMTPQQIRALFGYGG